jgi:hypothetical protein
LLVRTFVVVLVPILGTLVFTASHAHIASDANAASLLGYHTAQSCALRQAREFLRRENDEGRRLDFQAVRHMGVHAGLGVSAQGRAVIGIHVLGILQFLIQSKAQTVLALMTNGQVRKDEVACWSWPVKVSHASHGRSCEDREAGRGWWCATRSNGPSILKSRKQEEVGVVGESDLALVRALAFEDA